MKTLLSLFDYSGAWAAPFADAGWNVIQWDIKHDPFMNILLTDSVEYCFEINGWESIDGIIAAVPCTDFASSGARWFKNKDREGQTALSIEITTVVLKIVDLYTPTDPDYEDRFFWAIENPVGRIRSLFPQLPKPYYFQPHEFAGYLNPDQSIIAELERIRNKNGHNLTAEEADFIIQWNVYTKKTGLWGQFNKGLVKKSIEPVKGSPYGSVMMRQGGKSDKTKEIRSNTPEGFAQAFYFAQTQC